jgi:hypothetical protein
MTPSGSSLARCFGVLLLLLLTALPASARAEGGDVKLKAQLVWATDHPKSKPEMKELDQKLSEKLRKMFKWKNYFEINQQTVTLGSGPGRKLNMSSKCDIELRQADDGTIEVKLFGEGKLVKTIRQPLKPLQKGEYAAIGGDDKDSYGDAWFVVLSVGQP